MKKQYFITKIALFFVFLAGQQLFCSSAKPKSKIDSKTVDQQFSRLIAQLSAETAVTAQSSSSSTGSSARARLYTICEEDDDKAIVALTTTMAHTHLQTQKAEGKDPKEDPKKEDKKISVATSTQTHDAKTLYFDENEKDFADLTPTTKMAFELDDEKFPSVLAYFEAQRFACAPRFYRLFNQFVTATSVEEMLATLDENFPTRKNTYIPTPLDSTMDSALRITLLSLSTVPPMVDLAALLYEVLIEYYPEAASKEQFPTAQSCTREQFQSQEAMAHHIAKKCLKKLAASSRVSKLFQALLNADSLSTFQDIVQQMLPEIDEFIAIKQYLLSHKTLPTTAELGATLEKLLSKYQKSRIRDEWAYIKIPLMTRALRAQIAQNKSLQQILLATDDKTLIFRNHDSFWGNGATGDGQNTYGKILMQIRDKEVKKGAFYFAKG